MINCLTKKQDLPVSSQHVTIQHSNVLQVLSILNTMPSSGCSMRYIRNSFRSDTAQFLSAVCTALPFGTVRWLQTTTQCGTDSELPPWGYSMMLNVVKTWSLFYNFLWNRVFRKHFGVILAIMMTSSNGNTFRVTGHLCGEFTGPRWIPRIKGQWRGTLMFSLICGRINGWVNNGKAGDLRRHRAHYDVIVMYWLQPWIWI